MSTSQEDFMKISKKFACVNCDTKIHRKEIIITPQNNNSRGNQTIQM